MIGVLQFSNTLPRLSIITIAGLRNVSTCGHPLLFKATDVVFGEPLKRKKKLDPAIIRQREERRRRKLEKQIRRLEKFSKQLKPIDELEVPEKLIEESEKRSRQVPPLATEESERRALLQKEWARYKSTQWLKDVKIIDTILLSQQRALDELKAESEELYKEATQIDPSLLPHQAEGPVHTPPIENYATPDGEYDDVTRKYEGEP